MRVRPRTTGDFLDRYWGLYGYTVKVVAREGGSRALWHAVFRNVKAASAEVARVNNTVQSTGHGFYRFWCIRPGAAKLKPPKHEPKTESGKRLEVDASLWAGGDELPSLEWQQEPFEGRLAGCVCVDFTLFDRFNRPVWWFTRPLKLRSPQTDGNGGYCMGLERSRGSGADGLPGGKGFRVEHRGVIEGGHGRGRFGLEVQHTDTEHTLADGSSVRYTVVGAWFDINFAAIRSWYGHDVKLRHQRQADMKVRKQVMKLTGMKGLNLGRDDDEEDNLADF
jgi:hypothetical protein